MRADLEYCQDKLCPRTRLGTKRLESAHSEEGGDPGQADGNVRHASRSLFWVGREGSVVQDSSEILAKDGRAGGEKGTRRQYEEQR